jgi:uncharacterized protein
VCGVADFVVRVVDPTSGAVSYEPADAKLVRAEANPGHVLQLCFYAGAIEALTGVRPRRMLLWLGSGQIETLNVNEFSPYWGRLRGQLVQALAAGPAAGTVPQPCPHCPFCEFSVHCEQQWRDEDSPVYVANIRQAERLTLSAGGVTSVAPTTATCSSTSRGTRSGSAILAHATITAAQRDCLGLNQSRGETPCVGCRHVATGWQLRCAGR